MQPEAVILHPVVTEKSARLSQGGQYVFAVHPGATKIQIAAAVAVLFKVKVRSVRTVNREGKRKRRGAHWTRRPASKRAIVTLVAGQQIDVTAA